MRLRSFARLIALLLALVALPRIAHAVGTTGAINGTVVDATTKAPLANVAVVASSPSGRATATTNARGFFAMTGLAVDTYAVTFTLTGYDGATIDGVTVNADQTETLSPQLAKALIRIGSVTGRSAGSAFQPAQTTDTYTVTQAQMTTVLGKPQVVNGEQSLITSLPGASFDQPRGYPILRGGRENEEGFQFEGIDYTDPYTSSYTNGLRLNGVGSLQVVPGAGDASLGNAGTGVINLTTKRGTYPPSGLLDVEGLLYPYNNQYALEYGNATRDGRVSNYLSYQRVREIRAYGTQKSPVLTLNQFFGNSDLSGNDLVDNFVYKFGRGQKQSLQIFVQNQWLRFGQNKGGLFAPDGSPLYYKTNDPLSLISLRQASGLSTAQIQQIIGLDPLQTSVTAPVRQSVAFPIEETLKLQYAANLSSSTYLSARYYHTNATTLFDYPDVSPGDASGLADRVYIQGGYRTGFGADVTRQFGDKHLVSLGGKYEFDHPIFDEQSNDAGFYAVAGFGRGYEAADFLSPADPACPKTVVRCGYLAGYFPGGTPRIPLYHQIAPVDQQLFGAYIRDQYTVSPKLKLDGGVRLDGANLLLGGFDRTATAPRVVEPRLAAAYRLGPSDAIRAGYGRSVEFAPLSDVENPVARDTLAPYAAIPSFSARTGKPATFCGLAGNQPCASYADQLYWEFQSAFGGVPYSPIKPETFSNYDLSYSHQFAHGIALKVTPFYRRGYDAAALVATLRTDAQGNPILNPATGLPLQNPAVATNLGTNFTSGVELLLTKDAAYGISGQLALTYINEFSNVIPLTASEDFFPKIPLASQLLGNRYRVGFISPFTGTMGLQYRTRGGWRVNPVVTYNRGFPIGAGTIAATFVNGKPYNVPNTNVTSPTGSALTSQYVDPANPGSLFAPHVAWTRGTPEAPSAGGVLSGARFNTNLTLEYVKPGGRSTFGMLVTNIFNQLYGLPTFNDRYQIEATGHPGPLTGTSAAGATFPLFQYPLDQYGNQAYRLLQNNNSVAFNPPLTYRLYWQVRL